MSKNLDETVRLQSEKRQEWIRELNGEKLQEIMERTNSAPRLVSSLAASFPGKDKLRGLSKSQKSLLSDKTGGKRRQFLPDLPQKIEIKENIKEKTRWQGQSESQRGGEEKRGDRLIGAAETSKEFVEWRKLQRKNLSILGLLKKKVALLPQREHGGNDGVGKFARVAFAERKRNRAVCLNHQIMRGENQG